MKDFKLNLTYLILLAFVLISSYSIYLLNHVTVINLCSEDDLFEGGTALFLFFAFLLFIAASRKNIFMIFLAVIFLFGAGEEISWGQRIIGFEVPENIKKENVQSEFNVHNMPTFNGTFYKNQHIKKSGWERITEMNFLYRVFLLSFGVLLPFFNQQSSSVRSFLTRIKMPIPPLFIGVFIPVSWIVNKTVLFILPPGHIPEYYIGTSEIWEFYTSFVIFLIGVYFFVGNKNVANISNKKQQKAIEFAY